MRKSYFVEGKGRVIRFSAMLMTTHTDSRAIFPTLSPSYCFLMQMLIYFFSCTVACVERLRVCMHVSFVCVCVGWIAWVLEGFVSNAPHHLNPNPRSVISPWSQTATTEQAGTTETSHGTEILHLWWFSHYPPMLFRVHTPRSSWLACGLNASLPNTIVL